MPTIKDVAADAGVSTATVSYVINETKFVSPELKQRVEASMKKLNYNVNSVARNLRRQESKTIGVVLQSVNDVFFSEVLLGLEECVRAFNYSLMFFNTNFDIQEERKAIDTLRNMRVDGILLDSCVEKPDEKEYKSFLHRNSDSRQVPIVSMERSFGPDTYAVISDNYGGAYAAAKHLIELGRRRILYISGKMDMPTISTRREGHSQAMADFDMGLPSFDYGDMDFLSGYMLIKKSLEYGKSFDAVACANDRMAVGVITALKELGIRVPDDIAVAGFDNIGVYSLLTPSLTSINVLKYQIGHKAAEMLLKHISGDDSQDKTTLLPTKLIVRNSTDSSVITTPSFIGL